MKMKFINRLLLALYALVWLLALVCVALGFLAPGVFQPVLDLIKDALNAIPFLPYILLGVMAVWSIGMFLLAFKREKRGDKGNVALQNTENGAVNVTVGALETLVKEAIGQNDEVLELKSQVVNHEDSITVLVRMVLSSTAHIPNVTMLMQRNIKRFIEEFSGIAVREVIITVTEVRSPEPAAKKRGLKNGKAPESIMAPAAPLPAHQEKTETPAALPVNEPVVEQPVQEPVVEQPAPEPVVETPAPEPVVETPAPEPAVEEPVQEPVVEEPAEEPIVEQPAQELTVELPAEEPVVEQEHSDEPR